MRSVNKILALLFLLAVPLVCGGQTYYFGRYFTLSKSYTMPGRSAADIWRMCMYDWDIKSIGLHDFGYPAAFNGFYCSFDTPEVKVGGKPVDLRGNVLFLIQDGGFRMEYTFISAVWNNGRKALFLPPLEDSPGYYISHMSREDRNTLSLIYDETVGVFGDLTSYFDGKVKESTSFSLEE